MGSLVRFFPLLMMVFATCATAVRWWRHPTRRARRLLAQSEPKALGAVADGERAHVWGFARRCAEQLRSPVTDRVCLGYRFVVEEHQESNWIEVWRDSECIPFDIVSDGLEARVEGPFLFGLHFDDRGGEGSSLPDALLASLWRVGISTTDSWGRPRRFRYREAVLEPNDPVSVLGDLETMIDPAGRTDASRGPPRLRVIRGTERHPVVLADRDAIDVVPAEG